MSGKQKKPTPYDIAKLVAAFIASLAALIQAIRWWQANGRGKPLPNLIGQLYNITKKGVIQVKKIIHYIPFIIAFMFIFVKEQTIYTRIAFGAIGLASLLTIIDETIKIKKRCNSNDN